MRRISIAGHSFEFAAAKLVAYHCAAGEADWNVELVREGEFRLARTASGVRFSITLEADWDQLRSARRHTGGDRDRGGRPAPGTTAGLGP